jgi:hypothetical protein
MQCTVQLVVLRLLHIIFSNMIFSKATTTTLSFILLILVDRSNRIVASTQTAERHPHSGRIEPYKLNPPSIPSLSALDRQTLARGEPVRTKWRLQQSERDVIIQDVDAPPDVVLSKILDYNNYKHMVPDALESSMYKSDVPAKGLNRYCVRLKSGTSAFKVNVFTEIIHDIASRTMAWTLDYNKKSDVDDLTGCKYNAGIYGYGIVR